MQLKISTDYAVRTVLYLAQTNGVISSGEIAENMVIPQNYLRKILTRLREADLVRIKSGVKGGAYLSRKPEDITMYDLVMVMENSTKINRCLENDSFCSRNATMSCPVRKVYTQMQSLWEEYLKTITIQSLLDGGLCPALKIEQPS